MKTQKVFLVIALNELNLEIRRNPLLPNEFHLAKKILNESDVDKIEIEVHEVTGETQIEIENKIALMF